MQTIQDKHTEALRAYAQAREALERARCDHEDGDGKTYAVLLSQQQILKAKIGEQEAAAATAEASFKRLFSEAGHEVTKDVKAALFKKNDSLSIADELRSALADSRAASVEAEIAASNAASSFQTAYRVAQAAHARVEVFAALSDCGEAMARAVAYAMHVPDADGSEGLAIDVEQRRAGLVWKELMTLAKALPEAQRLPRVTELGSLDLGAFKDRGFLTSAGISLLRKQLALRSALTIEAVA